MQRLATSNTLKANPFTGGQAAILTKHQKLPLVAPALANLGIQVQLYAEFDTDTLGTFAGEVPRQQSPLDCVKTKARLASELSGCRFGIGSEGSFGGGPMPGVVNWDEELLCWYDREHELYVVANAAGPMPLKALTTANLEQLHAHVTTSPAQQGWIGQHSGGLLKGLVGMPAILSALQQQDLLTSAQQLREPMLFTPDLRAHYCPPRQQVIRQAAVQLAERLASCCPACQAPDFWVKQVKTGLPCADCDFPTHRVQQYVKICGLCGHLATEPAAERLADPSSCPRCNP